jgi:hypothetical protein
MSLNIAKEVAALQQLPATELRAKHAELFGEPTKANNRAWLVKRLAWRLQALADADLSERARQRAAELANDVDLRLTPPKAPRTPTPAPAALTPVQRSPVDGRLPPPGTILTRKYKGELLQVQVLPDGFAFQGEVYRSLSAVAKAITGAHCNGFLFFRLATKG